MPKDIHKKYKKCLINVARELRNKGIAEVDLSSHIHPEFDFRVNPPIIQYARVKVNAYNPKLLKEFVRYMNERLKGHGVNSCLRLWESASHEGPYNIEIYPDYNSPKDKWLEETEKVMCCLSSAVEDFFMKRN